MSSRRRFALSIPASGSSCPATEEHVASIEVPVTVAVYPIPAAQQYVTSIEVAVTVAVYPIPAAQQYVTSIKVTVSVTVYSANAPLAVPAIIVVIPDSPRSRSVRTTTIPTPITSVVTVHELSAFLIVKIPYPATTTASALAE